MLESTIHPTIPLDRDGTFHGHLKLPHSANDSAWGAVMIPVSVIRNGPGATVLCTGANHGDEYEGPIALNELALNLDPSDINGRIIIVPAFNYPAFKAGTRNSPIDDGNLNRVFPGHPQGTVTEKIADYFTRVLLPQADVVLDIHSGGKTLEFVPLASAHILPNKQQQAACVAAMQAFNAPHSLMALEISSVGMYDTEAENQGKVFVTTELGGGGTTRSKTIEIARKGIRNVLIHVGVLNNTEPTNEPSINISMPDDDCFIVSEQEGLLEPVANLGEQTIADETVIAKVWPLDRTGIAPAIYRARKSGLLVGRHFPGLIKLGDCMAVIAQVD